MSLIEKMNVQRAQSRWQIIEMEISVKPGRRPIISAINNKELLILGGN